MMDHVCNKTWIMSDTTIDLPPRCLQQPGRPHVLSDCSLGLDEAWLSSAHDLGSLRLQLWAPWASTIETLVFRVLATSNDEATRNKCIATSNKCLTSSNKKLL